MGGGGIEPHTAIPISVECIGGIGEKKSNSGSQFYQQDRIYDGTKLATALSGNLPSGANMYSIPVEISASDGIGGGTPASEDADGEGLQGHWKADYERSFGIDQTRGGKEKVIADAIKSRYNAGFHVNRKNMHTAVGLPIIFDGYNQRLRTDGLACTLTHNCGQGTVRGGQQVIMRVEGINTTEDGTARTLTTAVKKCSPANLMHTDGRGISGGGVDYQGRGNFCQGKRSHKAGLCNSAGGGGTPSTSHSREVKQDADESG